MITNEASRLKTLADETICVTVMFIWAAAGTEGCIRLVFGPFESRNSGTEWAQKVGKELMRTWPIRLASADTELVGTLRKGGGPVFDEMPCLEPKDPGLLAHLASIVIQGRAREVRAA